MMLNCDIGERGVECDVDLAILPHIHIANIACGGHAGDAVSARFFLDLARQHDVVPAAHVSYPDRDNFGRLSQKLNPDALVASMDEQLSLLDSVSWLKFHGALYNDACADPELADRLADWLVGRGVSHVITPAGSALSTAVSQHGAVVVPELFGERRYQLDESNRLGLVPRGKSYACIHDCKEALEQVRGFVLDGKVKAVVREDSAGMPLFETCPVRGETICVHSDSAIALPLIELLVELGVGRR